MSCYYTITEVFNIFGML